MRRYRLPLLVSSWLTFAISLTFYWITSDPGVSYWDCPEYVTVASRMEVGHPPGNPIWMLAMRVATIPFPPALHAYVINLWSGLFMAFASLFLCRVIFAMLMKLKREWFESAKSLIPFRDDGSNPADHHETDRDIKKRGRGARSGVIMASVISVCASLCFALCDSAWYSAVEAEVYAMSAFLSALSLWIMVLWSWEKSPGKRTRLLTLVAYLTGISLGVHQLNLLLIPVFGLIIVYRRHKERIRGTTMILWLAVSMAIVGAIMMLLLPLTLQGAQQLELFGVNKLQMPYNSGVLIFCCLVFVALSLALFIFNRLQWKNMSLTIWCVAFLLLGFSSFGVIMIRGAASPPMNEGTPGDIFSLSAYIQRDQYPKQPLIYGHTPYSQPMFEEQFVDGRAVYNRYVLEKGKAIYQPVMENARLNHRSRMLSHKDSLMNERVEEQGHGYLLTDYSINQKLTPELDMWFPRITSRNINHRKAYAEWVGMTEATMDRVSVSETIDSLGVARPRIFGPGFRPEVMSYRPTYRQHLEYFLVYQTYYMYFRYLFWNFIGRQNDYHSTGEIEHGNFITGIDAIDSLMVGDRSKVPYEIGEGNKGYNRYFGIPFLFGLIGIIGLLTSGRKGRRLFSLIFLLFIMTGLAIVVYLNQNPAEARERDYTFLVSYMAFAMWIGAGFGVVGSAMLRLKNKWIAAVITIVVSLCPPTLMALENFDDHDRRGRYETAYYASSLLDFELPAIIFTHGDNTSFPVWYAREVLEIGKEHTPVDITYFSLPAYVENLKRQGNGGLETMAKNSDIRYGKYLFTKIPPDSDSEPMPLEEALRGVYASEENIPAFPTSLVKVARTPEDSVTLNLHDFTAGGSLLGFRHLMLLDVIAGNSEKEEPMVIYFPSLLEKRFAGPLNEVLRPAMFGKIYAPWMNDSAVANLMKEGMERELNKIESLNPREHYNEPFIDDRTRRYRGELIAGARQLIERGDTTKAIEVVGTIEKYFPYKKLLPGWFTLGDSTYYEGKEYGKLLRVLYDSNRDESFLRLSTSLDSLMENRYKEWNVYYNSLSKEQRRKISNRSLHLLIK